MTTEDSGLSSGARIRGNRVSNGGKHGINVSVPAGMPVEIAANDVTDVDGHGINLVVRDAEHLVNRVREAELSQPEQLLLASALEQTVGTAGQAAEAARAQSKRVADVLMSVSTTVVSSTLVAVVKQALHIP